MHTLLKVPAQENPTTPGLPMSYGRRVMQSSLLAVGTLDDQGRPWTTVWGGERGFARPIAQGVLGINSNVDTQFDPVFNNLWGGEGKDGQVVNPGGGQGKDMAALSIDLKTRDRVKLAGKMIAGAIVGESTIQMAMVVAESLGNCPKYLNKKEVVPHEVKAELASEGLPLTKEAMDLIERADMLFLSSTNGEAMDTNHRGGPPGFIRVVRNEKEGVELVYPECEPPFFEILIHDDDADTELRLWKQALPNPRQLQSQPPHRHRHPRLQHRRRPPPHRHSIHPRRRRSLLRPRQDQPRRQDHSHGRQVHQVQPPLSRRRARVLTIQPSGPPPRVRTPCRTAHLFDTAGYSREFGEEGGAHTECEPVHV